MPALRCIHDVSISRSAVVALDGANHLTDADLLVWVVDASDDAYETQLAEVSTILSELELGNKPRVVAFNKADRIDSDEAVNECKEDNNTGTTACVIPG